MTQNDNTVSMREGEELDVKVIDTVLKDNISGLEGKPDIRQFKGGHSNLTYAIAYKNCELVLRRPPHGTKPKSGHSMIREYKVMNALKPVFSAVPETFFYMSGEGSPLGAEFYVMERVAGVSLGKKLPSSWGFGEKETNKLGVAFFQKLIDLHNVDYKAAGLGDFGKPEGYVERQILGWNRRYERVITDDVEDYQDVRKWLEDNMPADNAKSSVLHGDYRLDNAILCADNPYEVKAILDWEISALGDPLMDLGNTLAYWTEANDPAGMQMMVMQPSTAPGMPTRAEIVEMYAKQTGLNCDKFAYYYIYGLFRNAVIIQQIYYRYKMGQSKNPAFANFGHSVNLLGNLARKNIEMSQIG